MEGQLKSRMVSDSLPRAELIVAEQEEQRTHLDGIWRGFALPRAAAFVRIHVFYLIYAV
jgi:hypothetical protein